MSKRFLTPVELPGNAASALHAVPKQQLDTEIATRAASAHTHPGQAVRASDYGWATGATASANDAAIAAAITAARGSSRRLYVGTGTYNISVPIDLKAFLGEGDCLEFFGDTRASTVINQTTATADVLQIGGYSAYLHDLTLRHSEAAFSSTPTTLGSGISMYKLAYSTVERVQLTCNGRGINIADAEVPNPGSSTGGGNYFHTVNFTDVFILRYGVSGIDLDNSTAVNTGSSFRNVWIQNQATNGTPVAPSGHALTLYLCDEMVFTQLNIEDYLGNMPVLINACGAIMFESTHFERANLNGADAQYFRVAGGSQLLIDGVTFAFSDVAVSGTTGTSHYFTAVTGGKLDLNGITIKNMDNTAARPLTLCELDDTAEGSSMDVAMPSGGDVDELTVLTNTSIFNLGYIRVGNKLGIHAMPKVLSSTRGATVAGGTISVDAALPDVGNNINITTTGNVTINVPTNGVEGQVLQYAVLASGGARTITFNASLGRLTGIAVGPTSIPSGKICRFVLRYTGLSSIWIVESFGITQ